MVIPDHATVNRRWLALSLVAVLAVSACAEGIDTSGAPAGEATPPPVAATPAEELATSEPAAEATPEPLPTPGFKAVKIASKGNKVLKLPTVSEPALLTFKFSGNGNIAVWSVAADGSQVDLLINEIDRYSGTTMFNDDGSVVALKIEADGKWSGTVKSLLQAPRWNPAKPLSGKGDVVYALNPFSSGLATIHAKYRGVSNFAIKSISSDGYELLFNEIGNYTGENLLPDGTGIIVISAAGGSWSPSVD